MLFLFFPDGRLPVAAMAAGRPARRPGLAIVLGRDGLGRGSSPTTRTSTTRSAPARRCRRSAGVVPVRSWRSPLSALSLSAAGVGRSVERAQLKWVARGRCSSLRSWSPTGPVRSRQFNESPTSPSGWPSGSFRSPSGSPSCATACSRSTGWSAGRSPTSHHGVLVVVYAAPSCALQGPLGADHRR